jgi:hypothetical protein
MSHRPFEHHCPGQVPPEKASVCGIYSGGMDTPFWDIQPYYGDRSKIMDPATVAEMLLYMGIQPNNTLVREVILFPTNEWH